MGLRKKPIPSPIARKAEDRPLVPAQARRSLPTIAALLAATAALSSTACQKDSHIEPDHEVVAVVKFVPTAVASTTVASPPAPPPPPGMGGLEVAAEAPAPPPPKVRPVHPPPPSPHPPMVKGGVKHVVPAPKTPKLSGDVAIVYPL